MPWARTSASAWLVAAALSALIGLLQYFDATEPFGGWVNRAGLGEAFGNLRQRNQFATLTNIGLAAVLWWLTLAATAARRWWWWLLWAALAALLMAANAASSSRTGLLQMGLLLAMAAYWGGRAPRAVRWQVYPLLLLAALAYGAAAALLPGLAGLDPAASGIFARLQHGDSACSSRLTLWGNVLHLIAQKPWLGWGWGELDYAHFITLYPGARFCDILDNAHNLPLHLAVELGIPVAAGFCLLCAAALWRGKPWAERDATRQLAWTVLALIGVHSLLEYPLWYGPFQMAAGLSLWLLLRPPERAGDFRQKHAAAGVACAVAATLLIAYCGYAAWDYWRISQIYRPAAARAPAYREQTLEKIRPSVLFRDQVRFAELTTTPLNHANAQYLHDLALEMLHFSPEARVAQIVIDSALLLGREDEALYYQLRLKAAFAQAQSPAQ